MLVERSVFHSLGLGLGLSRPNTARYSSTHGPTGEFLTERVAKGFQTAACERTVMFNSRHEGLLRGVGGDTISVIVFAAMTLSACSVVGPASIDHGRTSYNEVIEDTSRQQALLNVVRVSKGESPLFIDVTEVDAATSAGGTLGGGVTGLGATANLKSTAGTIAGPVESVTGSVSYQEAPTVRYFPLSGNALIAQVSTPIRPDSLVNLYNSDWPLAAILDLGVNRVTSGYEDYDAAIDAMIDLDAYGALILAATSSDSLTLYPAKRNVAERQAQCDGKQKKDADEIVGVLWRRLAYYINGSNGGASSITIQSRASESPRGKGQPPFLQTRSALGVMKAATDTTGRQSIAFLSPEAVRQIIDDYKLRSEFCRQIFYTLVPGSYQLSVFGHGGEFKAPTETETKVGDVISQRERSLITMNTDKAVLNAEELRTESDLVNARKYMLIAVSDAPPENAFASINHGGKWYYIFDDDEVSKKTLALIMQINTIQAIPSQSAPLTPTISVGAR
jgi:hypothetical protein